MKIWKRNTDINKINKNMENTMTSHLGIIITEISEDTLEGTMPVTSNIMQPYGIVHGGASVTLAETLGSLASNLCIDQKSNTVGLEINANHIRAVKGGIIKGITKPIHIGRSTHVWEVMLFNDEKVICISRLTMAILNSAK
jgi:1,4-dihydroxy-2-naphthoyl-CoA hydrolase|tara:strand:+ start:288 stop:710 length:423 start_codon:yes stop_codon:yes gene_type:complete